MKKEKYLIVGLGNPGEKYIKTYHNLGFLVLDDFLRESTTNINFSFAKKLNSEIAEITTHNKQIILVKPQTFMNLSGQATHACINYFKVSLENVLIVQDDSDLILGKIRFVKNSGAGGHNGISSIIQSIGTKDFARLKIGIRSPINHSNFTLSAGEIVLKRITKADQVILEKAISVATKSIDCFVEKGFSTSCNLYNKSEKS
ncbi:MAG TPA: aminoacyl-tRNA hydrolase [Candidatus Moranbacteria bacterium]|nr:aminoacyl-tRNA hydrolase [Candidatus Moranbacteria bacterium]